MERRFRLLMLSATVGWMLAFAIGMTYFLLTTARWFQTPPTSAIVGGAIAGLMGSRMTIQQVL